MDNLIKKYHSQQFRNNNEGYLPAKVPYYDHLYGVRSILSFALYRYGECSDAMLKEDMLNAALGHDLLEDTIIHEEEIVITTNERVLSLIKELTNPVDDSHTDLYMQQLSNASEEARLIKYADLIENTTCVCHNMHVVSSDWYMDVYRPILFGTMGVLEKTQFPNYPKTVQFLRDTLRMFADLLHFDKHIPMQYPVKAVQTMREAISENDLNAHIENSYSNFQNICKMHRNGYMLDDECDRLFREEFWKGFYDYLNKKRVHTKFTDDTWTGFLEDYSLWQNGKGSYSAVGNPWLVYDDSEAASVLDKNRFFKLMEAYYVPSSYFKPIPDGCVKPKQHFDMYGTGMAGTVRFDLTDDGGLYTCGNPIGHEFILVDDTGLKASISVERAGKKDEIHNRMDPQYVGHGTIEGYTSSRPREIFISKQDKGIVWFWISVENDDLDVLHHFPLWEPYNAFEMEWQEKSRDHIRRLIARFDMM